MNLKETKWERKRHAKHTHTQLAGPVLALGYQDHCYGTHPYCLRFLLPPQVILLSLPTSRPLLLSCCFPPLSLPTRCSAPPPASGRHFPATRPPPRFFYPSRPPLHQLRLILLARLAHGVGASRELWPSETLQSNAFTLAHPARQGHLQPVERLPCSTG